MPLGITTLKDLLTLLKRLRWFLALVIFFAAAGLAWYGWQSGRGLVWIVFGSVFLLFVVIVVLGGKISFWLARRLINQLLHNKSSTSQRLASPGLQQGEKLIQLGKNELGKNVTGIKQEIGQTLTSFSHEFRTKPGKVTWVSAPPTSPYSDLVCPACGRGLRSGAKFCDHCGKPIRHS